MLTSRKSCDDGAKLVMKVVNDFHEKQFSCVCFIFSVYHSEKLFTKTMTRQKQPLYCSSRLMLTSNFYPPGFYTIPNTVDIWFLYNFTHGSYLFDTKAFVLFLLNIWFRMGNWIVQKQMLIHTKLMEVCNNKKGSFHSSPFIFAT